VLHSLPQRRSRAALQSAERGESIRTIVIALLANLVIAVAKLIAGLLSRSTALLAEAAHSFADTLNEVLLAVSLRRARRPADASHPIGHGREGFLWALMAAIASFLIGGCLSIALAIREFGAGGSLRSTVSAWVVLIVSFLAEGTSWLQSMRQARREAREHGRPVWRHLLEVIVAAKVHPSSRLTIDELARAMDDLDHQLRAASPFVADVYLDVTNHRATIRDATSDR